MVTPARPLASGRDCDVYALADGRVVRSYKDGRSAEAEAELIRAVHALGYPVPRVDEWDGPRIVMERIDGPTLGEQLLAGTVAAEEGALIQADLQGRLHALPWPGGPLGRASCTWTSTRSTSSWDRPARSSSTGPTRGRASGARRRDVRTDPGRGRPDAGVPGGGRPARRRTAPSRPRRTPSTCEEAARIRSGKPHTTADERP